ncbi:MAG: hypothetical protein LBF09_07795 [Odoribacteraceae bacterium]|jgi:hypothetical protein|nr:hypothetical protein [Odoribacteraceae bacterium]
MFENFKKKLKRNRLAKRTTRASRELSFQNFQTARSCLLFCIDGERQAGEIERLRDMLSGKTRVEILILEGDAGHPATGTIEGAVRASDKDISLSGKFVNARLHEMMHFSHDLLVDLSRGACSVGDYLLASSAAKCKIGMERDGFQCDIVFEGIKEVDELQGRLNELLEKIKTH